MAAKSQPKKKKRALYVKEWMAARGFSDETLGQKMGVDRATIFRWHSQQHRLNPDKLESLADALDIEPVDFHRHPDTPSLDSLVNGISPELRETAYDVVRRLVGKP